MSEEAVSRVLFPQGVAPRETVIIPLRSRLLETFSDLTRPALRRLSSSKDRWISNGPPLSPGFGEGGTYLVLHRVGFTELPMSPSGLVSSYLAVSPLPGFL